MTDTLRLNFHGIILKITHTETRLPTKRPKGTVRRSGPPTTVSAKDTTISLETGDEDVPNVADPEDHKDRPSVPAPTPCGANGAVIPPPQASVSEVPVATTREPSGVAAGSPTSVPELMGAEAFDIGFPLDRCHFGSAAASGPPSLPLCPLAREKILGYKGAHQLTLRSMATNPFEVPPPSATTTHTSETVLDAPVEMVSGSTLLGDQSELATDLNRCNIATFSHVTGAQLQMVAIGAVDNWLTGGHGLPRPVLPGPTARREFARSDYFQSVVQQQQPQMPLVAASIPVITKDTVTGPIPIPVPNTRTSDTLMLGTAPNPTKETLMRAWNTAIDGWMRRCETTDGGDTEKSAMTQTAAVQATEVTEVVPLPGAVDDDSPTSHSSSTSGTLVPSPSCSSSDSSNESTDSYSEMVFPPYKRATWIQPGAFAMNLHPPIVQPANPSSSDDDDDDDDEDEDTATQACGSGPVRTVNREVPTGPRDSPEPELPNKRRRMGVAPIYEHLFSDEDTSSSEEEGPDMLAPRIRGRWEMPSPPLGWARVVASENPLTPGNTPINATECKKD
jgi:hypothetical protein